MTQNRLSKRHIPNKPTGCHHFTCPYNSDGEDGICDNPRNNKGNSDANCHKTSIKDLLHIWLEINDE